MNAANLYRLTCMVCLTALVLALTACGGNDSSDASSQRQVVVEQTGATRSYQFYLPASAQQASPVPLVLLYHGGFGSPESILNASDMKAKARAEGFALATLKAVNGLWNAGHEGNGTLRGRDVNDVAYTKTVISQLNKTENIDLDRVYAVGFSMGGAMVYRVACQLSERIAAITVVSGYSSQTQGAVGLNKIYPCDQSTLAHPMPILHIHGLADQCVKYKGGIGEGFNKTRPNSVFRTSVRTTIKRWSERNGCLVQSRPPLNPGTGCIARRRCNTNSVVKLCTIKEHGHVWPGDARYRPVIKEQCGGTQTGGIGDTNATDRFWNFVKDYSLSQLTQ